MCELVFHYKNQSLNVSLDTLQTLALTLTAIKYTDVHWYLTVLYTIHTHTCTLPHSEVLYNVCTHMS